MNKIKVNFEVDVDEFIKEKIDEYKYDIEKYVQIYIDSISDRNRHAADGTIKLEQEMIRKNFECDIEAILLEKVVDKLFPVVLEKMDPQELAKLLTQRASIEMAKRFASNN